MSTVFVVKSNIGPLIIHVSSLVKEHRRNRVWEKFFGLADLIAAYPEIPAPTIRYAGLLNSKFILVQNFLDGSPAGKRILENNIISDNWRLDRAEIIKKILRALSAAHEIKFKKFGWPGLKTNRLEGRYKTSKEFFGKEAPRWIETIKKADKKFSNKITPIKELDLFAQKIIARINYAGPAVLVHGDAVNPSNILVNNKKEILLLDWEWSTIADPAWEFCDLGWWPLLNQKVFSPYFKARGIEDILQKENFLERARLYAPLWLLWGTHMHAHDSSPDVYLALHKLLVDRTSAKD